jgi:hypothetical protein
VCLFQFLCLLALLLSVAAGVQGQPSSTGPLKFLDSSSATAATEDPDRLLFSSSATMLNDTAPGGGGDLSVGSKVGIAVGVIGGVGLMVGLAFLCHKQQEQEKENERQTFVPVANGGNERPTYGGTNEASAQHAPLVSAPHRSSLSSSGAVTLSSTFPTPDELRAHIHHLLSNRYADLMDDCSAYLQASVQALDGASVGVDTAATEQPLPRPVLDQLETCMLILLQLACAEQEARFSEYRNKLARLLGHPNPSPADWQTLAEYFPTVGLQRPLLQQLAVRVSLVPPRQGLDAAAPSPPMDPASPAVCFALEQHRERLLAPFASELRGGGGGRGGKAAAATGATLQQTDATATPHIPAHLQMARRLWATCVMQHPALQTRALAELLHPRPVVEDSASIVAAAVPHDAVPAAVGVPFVRELLDYLWLINFQTAAIWRMHFTPIDAPPRALQQGNSKEAGLASATSGLKQAALLSEPIPPITSGHPSDRRMEAPRVVAERCFRLLWRNGPSFPAGQRGKGNEVNQVDDPPLRLRCLTPFLLDCNTMIVVEQGMAAVE